MSVKFMSYNIKLGDRVKMTRTHLSYFYGILQDIWYEGGTSVDILEVTGARTTVFIGEIYPCEDVEYDTQVALSFIQEAARHERRA